MKRLAFFGPVLLVSSFFVIILCTPVSGLCSSVASAIWGSDASAELSGSRTSTDTGGVYASPSWDDGDFVITWNITENDDGTWTYIYTLNVPEKDISHFILEVTEDGALFNFFEGSYEGIEGPATYSRDGSNPEMPNSIYGIKFDYGSLYSTYTIVTDRAPVYGVFYAKDGKDGSTPAFAWSSALNYSDYKTNAGLTATDFIVRPNGTATPLPGAVWLFGSALTGIVGLRRKRRKSSL